MNAVMHQSPSSDNRISAIGITVRNIKFLIILKTTKTAGLAHLKLSSPAVMLFCSFKTVGCFSVAVRLQALSALSVIGVCTVLAQIMLVKKLLLHSSCSGCDSECVVIHKCDFLKHYRIMHRLVCVFAQVNGP